VKKIIDLELFGSRNGKQWAKTVSKVDQSQSSGYAFVGQFIETEGKQEFEVGTYIMQYAARHTRIRGAAVKLSQVTPGGLAEIKEWNGIEGNWALECRDEIADIVNAQQKVNPLEAYSTEDLLAELKLRGVNIG